jgi:hypothetical protein
MRVGMARTVATAVAVVSAAMAGPAWAPAGAAPDAGTAFSHAAGTWGACGSWWEQTATEFTSGSVCGLDGVTLDNGQPVQLAEPQVWVSRYVCSKTKPVEGFECTSESYQGTGRRSDMSVDPLLRRATIRGAFGGCVLDLEFAGVSPPEPQGSVWEAHGLGGTPSVTVFGGQTFSTLALWWGQVCGQVVVVQAENEGEAQLWRGLEANVSGGQRPEGEH